MRRMQSESGAIKGIWILVALGLLVLLGMLAGRLWLAGFVDPANVAARLETMIGDPVTVGDVELRPFRREAVITGFELRPSTSVESAVLGLNLRAIIAGRWEFSTVELVRPVWSIPANAGDYQLFLRGLMLPLLLASRSDHVRIN